MGVLEELGIERADKRLGIRRATRDPRDVKRAKRQRIVARARRIGSRAGSVIKQMAVNYNKNMSDPKKKKKFENYLYGNI